MHGISARLHAAWQMIHVEPHFRDPAADFLIAPTVAQALAGSPSYRSLHGPYLTEHGNYVSLHLGCSTTDGVHAIMDRTAPSDLVFSYTRIMAGFTRFTDAPRTIGMLGLGGGSLAKHCYDKFPESRILVAEISPEVIALRRQFHIPDDDARFSIVEADGASFIRQGGHTFDVLLIDAFDEGGSLPHLSTRRFYQNCHRALTARGVLVLNFSGEHWRHSTRRLNRVFRNQTVLYECPDGANTIAFATRSQLPPWTGRPARSKR